MAKKGDVFKAILAGAVAFIPGGQAVRDDIERLLHKNDNPDDDVDEVADAIADLAVDALIATEGLTGKNIVNDPVVRQVAEGIKNDIRLLQLVLVRKDAA